MILLTNQLVSYMSSPLGFKVTDYEIDSEEVEVSSRKILKDIIDEILRRDLGTLLKTVVPYRWEHMLMNVILIRQTFTENTQLYSEILPPEIFGKLLQVNKNFKSFDHSFGLLPELFTKNPSEWPENKGGIENNKLIRNTLLNGFSKNLKKYFEQLKDLIYLVDEWKRA